MGRFSFIPEELCEVALAVLSLLSLAIASIACVPPANAAPPQASATAPAEPTAVKTYIINLEEHPAFFISMKSPGLIRIARIDSAGVPGLRVDIGDLPNPAMYETSTPKHIDRQASSSTPSGPRTAFDVSRYAEKSGDYRLPFPAPSSDRKDLQRVSSALRAATLVGTLVRQGRRDRS